MCLVFPPLVSLYGLFPVLVSCDYEFIWFQVCVIVNYLVYLSPVFVFHFVWSTCYSRCVYLALCYPDVVIKDYYFEVRPRLRVPRLSLLCAPWQKTRPNSKRRPFTSFCFVRFFKCVILVPCFGPRGKRVRSPRALMPAVRGSWRRRSRLSHPAVRGSSRRRSWINQPTVRRRWRRRRPRLTLAHRPAGLPLTQCPPACLWLNARRPASDSMPAGLPLIQARWIAADSSPPDCRWLMPAGRRWRGKPTHFLSSRRRPRLTDPAVRGKSRRRPWGKPTHRRRLPLVRGEGQPAVRGHSARRRLWLPPALLAPAVGWSSQPVMVSPAGHGRNLARLWPKVFLTVFQFVSPRRAPGTPELPHGFFLGGYKGPGCSGRAEGRGHGHERPPALASWAPCSSLAYVCLFRSGGPFLCMSLCRSCGVSRVPTPPPW